MLRVEVSESASSHNTSDVLAILGAAVNPAAFTLNIANSRTLSADYDELQHRLKNMLAVVQAITLQTARHCATKEILVQQLVARLSSYSRSIDQLIAHDWAGLDIRTLLRSQLSAFDFDDETRFLCEGPSLTLSSRAARSLGFAFNELATNAVKHGSLSVGGGRVTITWDVGAIDGEKRFHLLWRESGGPDIVPPTRCGFGRQVIQVLTASALGGTTTYQFPPKGVNWSLDAPASKVLI
jgi:two-component sensor histidine kinase